MNLAHPVIALDGEGYTDRKGRHRYTYLAACSADKTIRELHRPRGIPTYEVLDFLLALPRKAILVGFALGYDRTKWIEDMKDGAIYALTHPELRTGEHGPRPVRWRHYLVNMVSRKFSVTRAHEDESREHRVVWDVWSFFQTSFVSALRKWGVGTEREVDRIERMKKKRASFKAIGPRERAYCRSECRLLATLVRELLDAHQAAGLAPATLFGPGSTATVMLEAMGADAHNVAGTPAFMRAVRRAFFGGRFEDSRVGPVRSPLYAYDLAGAYPYAWCLLPCLRHGRWRKVGPKGCEKALARGRLALVRWRLPAQRHQLAWGPLPFRLGGKETPEAARGNIVFPARSAGGYAWSPEVVAGRKLARIEVRGGWVYEKRCHCGHPFRRLMVGWYKERLRWGSKGRGRVLRLGMNSCTGKSMQAVGAAKYRCLVRAGLVTSYTRARLLEAIASASSPWHVLEVATDSVLASEPLSLPAPVDLGTARAAKRAGNNPLGAWDTSPVNPDGAFLCRPGMRFRLGEADEGETAARGLGVSALHAARAAIMASWQKQPLGEVRVPAGRTFIGAKSGIRRVGRRGWKFKRSPDYGRWVEPPPRLVSFKPGPKRDAVLPTHAGQGLRLSCWELPMGRRYESAGYDEEQVSEAVQQLRDEENRRDEQG